MRSLADLHDEFYDEIGSDLTTLVGDEEITRWVNAGQRRLAIYRAVETDLSWSEGDREVAFPDDYRQLERIIPDDGVTLRQYQVRENSLRFLDPEGADEDGTATLLYQGRYPKITGTQDSLLSEDGDDAIVAYALYRFFRKLATNRSNYKRYSTLVGANAVSVEDLIAIAGQHLDEFLAVQEGEPPADAVMFYGG